MNRTRAEALVLVNWKGVFYERYLLDRHVTALEGANGAGKTTVMIAAYVVLLPDMSRLRFTNLGETGATGGDKGIWGRLGQSGRPSYAAIDFTLAGGGRLVAGVRLERKGEPSVEPTPFIVSGLGADVRLQELMLVSQGDSEAVPELTELRENAARVGGRLQELSAKDYFATLFEQGVFPLRLGTDEERGKLNEMLRTSMTGGISRALTSELRSFLLKEESGLADTLQRMKANLDACRRTRTEVQESRKLEQEIGGVFEAGQHMFAAAFLATRDRAEDSERRLREAEAQHAAVAREADEAEEALARTVAELESVEERRTRSEAELAAAKQKHATVRDALAAAEGVERARKDLHAAETVQRAAFAARTDAETVRDCKREELKRAQENYRLAAKGRGDLQAGIQELHRRAGDHRQAVRRLHDAESALQVGAIATDQVDPHLADARKELARLDRERQEASARVADADAHRLRHGIVLQGLLDLVGRPVSAEEAHPTAVEALRRYRDQRVLADRLVVIACDLGDARRNSERQAAARATAAKFEIALGDAPGGIVVRRALDDVEAERAAHEAEARRAREELAKVETDAAGLEAQRRELAARGPAWRELDARAARLVQHVGAALTDREELDRARRDVSAALAATLGKEKHHRDAQERSTQEARDLLAAGGPFEPELLRLKDQLGASLVAESFEDVAIHDAAPLEARLGPLSRALVVDDPASAAVVGAGRADALADVWLVSREGNIERLAHDMGAGKSGGRDVVVDEGVALRVSRIPDRPRLGRRAREARAEELREEAERHASELGVARTRRGVLERLEEDGDALLEGSAIWLAGDPGPEIERLKTRVAELRRGADALEKTAKDRSEAANALGPRVEGLRVLLADALLLDPPDHAARATELETHHQSAVAAKAEVQRAEPFAEIVDTGMAELRSIPLSEAEVSDLRDRMDALRRQRDRFDAAVEALEYVHQHVEALSWTDAPARLESERSLVPEIEAQAKEAASAENAARDAADAAENHATEATTAWHGADAKRGAALERHSAATERFHELGVVHPTEESVRAAEAEVGRLAAQVRGIGSRERDLLLAKGGQAVTATNARTQANDAEGKVGTARREAEPAIARWERLQAQAAERGLSGGAAAFGSTVLSGVRGHVVLVQIAKTQSALLLERLRSAQGSAPLLAQLDVLRDTSDTEFADAALDLWLVVRDWLRRRLPAHVAEVDDPREALLRLRAQLTSLEERLDRQEGVLRGASEDVARGIEVQIRKARGQIQRLNKNLGGTSFGSIQGIRVRLNPVERMEQVLRALREGAAQALLFQHDIPIEDALDEIFKRHGGGGRTSGQRLLDYREYVHLQVEILRKSGLDWEIANPTRLSTGEAIGVGAALMMVVLTEWERDVTLLRGKKSHGSLRFLFLDEANRLSHDNLGVLFDLCQTLDLQLLIAAPEVARAEGNTTYRLVRHVSPTGEERVEVTGRRTRAEA